MRLPASRMPHLRPAMVLVHRWVGLAMAGFLLLAGLTGVLLAWYDELEAWISPQLFHIAAPDSGAQPLDPLALRERVQAAYPHAWAAYAPLSREPGRTTVFYLFALPDPATGREAGLPNNQVFVDPYTGQVLGERNWGEISQGLKNLMPFIYRLHYELALGVVGSYAFGIVALLWTLDCFIGVYLTFPAPVRSAPGRPAGSGKPWLVRWKPSWKVRWHGGSYKLNFDLHRAGGLWVWGMLFVLAWSSVAFNLSEEVYEPVMHTLFAHQPDDSVLPRLAPPQACAGHRLAGGAYRRPPADGRPGARARLHDPARGCAGARSAPRHLSLRRQKQPRYPRPRRQHQGNVRCRQRRTQAAVAAHRRGQRRYDPHMAEQPAHGSLVGHADETVGVCDGAGGGHALRYRRDRLEQKTQRPPPGRDAQGRGAIRHRRDKTPRNAEWSAVTATKAACRQP